MKSSLAAIASLIETSSGSSKPTDCNSLRPNVFHAAGLAEVDLAAELVLIDDEIKDFGLTHNCGHCCGVGFICVCVASELVEFLGAFICRFLGAFCGLCLKLFDALTDAISKC